MFVVFDLDDTLADTRHRHHILGSGDYSTEQEMWDAFFKECDKDLPKLEIIEVLNSMAKSGHEIEIWTGRSDIVREQTETWLSKHLNDDLGLIRLRMRKQGDHRRDIDVKSDFMQESQTPDLVFDDRNSVVRWWRQQGIACCQVKESDF